MAIVIKFENPPGNELNTVQFEPGQPLRIGVNVTYLGVSSMGAAVNIYVRSTWGDEFAPLSFDDTADWLGNCWFDIVLPNVIAKAKVTVNTHDVINWLSSEVKEINIGIGTVPDEPPSPPIDLTQWLVKYGPPILIVSVVVLGGLYISTWLPKSPVKKSVLSRNPVRKLRRYRTLRLR